MNKNKIPTDVKYSFKNLNSTQSKHSHYYPWIKLALATVQFPPLTRGKERVSDRWHSNTSCHLYIMHGSCCPMGDQTCVHACMKWKLLQTDLTVFLSFFLFSFLSLFSPRSRRRRSERKCSRERKKEEKPGAKFAHKNESFPLFFPTVHTHTHGLVCSHFLKRKKLGWGSWKKRQISPPPPPLSSTASFSSP